MRCEVPGVVHRASASIAVWVHEKSQDLVLVMMELLPNAFKNFLFGAYECSPNRFELFSY